MDMTLEERVNASPTFVELCKIKIRDLEKKVSELDELCEKMDRALEPVLKCGRMRMMSGRTMMMDVHECARAVEFAQDVMNGKEEQEEK